MFKSNQSNVSYNLAPDAFDDLPIDAPLAAVAADAVDHDPFIGEHYVAAIPATASQREVWLAALLGDDANLAYNEGLCITLKGALDEAALRHALQTVLNRHESLRAHFTPNGEQLLIRAHLPLDLPLHDLRGPDAAQRLANLEHSVMGRVFDIDNEALIRFTLAQTGDEEHHLLLVAHHLICDGWSGAILIMEIGSLYSTRVEHRVRPLPPAPRSGDYALIEQRFHGSEAGKAHETYWLDRLKNLPEPPALPNDKPRPAQRTFTAARIDVPLDPALVARLRAVGGAHGASLVATTLAGFAAMLYRLTGEQDLVIGLAAAGQAFHQQRYLVSHCVNLLPLRIQLDGAAPFTETLKRTRDAVMDGFDHQGVTFGKLLPQLAFTRDPQRPPIVSVMFNIDMRDDDITHSGLSVSYRTLVRHSETFEMFVNLVDDGKSLLLECSYNSDLFTPQAMQARMAEYGQLLAAICETPTASVNDLPLLTVAARQQLEASNATATALPMGSVPSLIAAQAARTPDFIALRCGTSSYSYAQMEARANTMAATLAAAGAGPGQRVGVCLERSLDLPVALLAVLKTGAAYLPLDPAFPADRLAYYLSDANVSLVLTDAASSPSLASSTARLLSLETITGDMAFVPVEVTTESPAYVIYTSGSTGQPKGVVLPHGALLNVLTDVAGKLGCTAQDVQLGVTTAAFDIAACDFFMPLLHGATLVLAESDDLLDGARLLGLIEQHHVTLLQCTPSTWRLLLLAGWTASPALKGVSTGEPLPRDLAEQLLPRLAALWNLYGPTETTVWSTGYQITDASQPILIGAPLANTQCHILNLALDEVPPGTPGTLWIGGRGVALGYHNRPELTAERFIDHPRHGRIYNTGDLAQLTPQGIECLGRSDFQVKLRGYRIELGEIEYALSRHPAVAESAVTVRERGVNDARLIAYVVTREGQEVNAGELRRAARDFLPSYMLPQEFVVLEALPRLPNGKLDRKALPDPFASRAAKPQREPPTGSAERALAGLWAEVLGLPDASGISREDRFFDLGGHSLLAVRLAARMAETYGSKPGLRTLMMDPLSVIAAPLQGPASQAAPLPATPARNDKKAEAGNLVKDQPVDIRIPTRAATEKRRGWWANFFSE